jgi:hypothetical protein
MRMVVVALVAAFVLVLGTASAGASNPSCAAQFVTQFAGPGFGTEVAAEAQAGGAAFGSETMSFGTAPHNSCPSPGG